MAGALREAVPGHVAGDARGGLALGARDLREVAPGAVAELCKPAGRAGAGGARVPAGRPALAALV
eukprot:2098975-Alexandrium_andersonii.AAC.1